MSRDEQTIQMLADVLEAMQKVRRSMPVYLAVLKQTGDKKQAEDAAVFVNQIQEEMEDAAAKSN